MVAVVAYVAHIEQPSAGGLILQIECPVLGVRKLVMNVVPAKQERPIKIPRRPASRITACGLLEVWQKGQESGSTVWRWRRWRCSERGRQCGSLCHRNRLHKRGCQRHAERPIEA